ncbi:hypothetical protein RIF29_37902 [Crotalaria pallida]|uniref:Cation efflux protein transmembrane domain-containing protein n=1 Tax=Crotalaria pallida TaxID=3830 RepID=A0AAN9E060_CROPI
MDAQSSGAQVIETSGDIPNVTNVAVFAISLFSLRASGLEATPHQSYGFFRIEIIGALVSIQMIWLQDGILVHEAIDRIISDPHEVDGVSNEPIT